MCGISGYISDRSINSAQYAEFMTQAISYRGRDQQGAWADDENVALYHSRLSIVDLHSGQQPMMSHDGRYVIVFNGEIYNYLELRKDLAQRGVVFRTSSDTEVIMEAYRHYGSEMCKLLNGMFAFAIWDTIDQKLFLARDHLGKKPLYWAVLNGVFVFSSTIDAFTSLPGWTGEICQPALGYFKLMGVFPLTYTLYDQVRAFPTASYAVVNKSQLQPRFNRYWHLNLTEKSSRPVSEIIEEYESILTDAVRLRLRSDVPLAVTYSGGVDSGSIAAICNQKLKVDLNYYTIDVHSQQNPSEEVHIAEQVAKLLGLHWEFISFDDQLELVKDCDRAFKFHDQPCNQWAVTYSLKMYDCIKQYATVVLAGCGADELFTGYVGDHAIYAQDLEQQSSTGFFSKWFRRKASQSSAGQRAMIEGQLGYVKAELCKSEQGDVIYQELLDFFLLQQPNSLLDMKMLTSLFITCSASNFVVPDINGMQAQVEVRAPYLDTRMVEFAARLPGKYKVGDPSDAKTIKWLPREYYSRYVTDQIAWASKKGMAYNVNFKYAFHEAQGKALFDRSMQMLSSLGIDVDQYYRTLEVYINHADRAFAPVEATEMMSSFLAGVWFSSPRNQAHIMRYGQVSV